MQTAAVGETFQSYFETERLCSELTALGFRRMTDLGSAQIAARFFPPAEHSSPGQGGHVMHAATV
jgi:hypothetical protein